LLALRLVSEWGCDVTWVILVEEDLAGGLGVARTFRVSVQLYENGQVSTES
jgi:hypothetical protein